VRRPAFRWWLAGTFALAIALLAACEVAGWPFLREPLQGALSKQLQRPLQIDAPFALHLFGSLRLHSAQLVVGPPAEAPSQADLVRARDIALRMPYATLWRLVRGHNDQPPVIDELSVDDLQAHLLRDAQGRANWQLRPAVADTSSSAAAPDLPRVGALRVRSGEIHVDDAMQQLIVQAHVSTTEGIAPAASGVAPAGLEVQARGSHRQLPLTGTLKSSGVLPLARRGDDASTVPIQLDLRVGRAHLTVDGRASDALQLGDLDAAFELAGPSLAAVGDVVGLTLPTTADFDLRGRVRKSGTVWAATVTPSRIGSSRLGGEYRYDTASTPPLLTGTLTGERLVLADLGPALGTPADPSRGKAPAERVLPAREFDVPSLQRMNADVVLNLQRLDLGTPQLESLAPLQGRLRLQRGVLSLQELLARTANGTLRGEITVDARNQQSPQWRADLRWGGIELERFIKARNLNTQKASAATRAPAYISGQLGGSANVTGRGRSIAAVMATADGNAGMWVRDGRISHLLLELSGIDVAESLGLLITGDETLPLRCAVTQLTLHDGRAVPETALIDTSDTTLLINGDVSLATEKLALVVKAQPHDMSLLALRAPLRVEGTFSQPQVRLDKSRIALRVAGAAALAAVAAPAALLALVDLGEDDRQRCADAVKRTQAASAVPARRMLKR
jgi:AsmA family protein